MAIKIERKYLAHFLDSSFGGTTSYIRLGQDLEEYTIELNPDVETTKNILGESSAVVKGYEPSGSVETFYAYEGDALFTQLASIVNNRSTGSSLETTVVDVLVTSTGTVTWAYREDVLVVPQSIGGDGAGVQIPFEIQYRGNRTAGTFDMATKEFTPA
ncbi:hypothetical protein [Anaerosacchariphilus polymeriproducens]|uniref:Phage tail protein n=1 Tax=Anaerosacchariphilus polymeriproducens TaxID=1812858 RepID=A0A371AQU5_9FIRM|nr:hypothetical protein [Anaerosacchariphilus polymeriproducens]RDU21939.1 hypothetical protein DWV06_15490 [Anaerosacchariphilus polymeriproducens]